MLQLPNEFNDASQLENVMLTAPLSGWGFSNRKSIQRDAAEGVASAIPTTTTIGDAARQGGQLGSKTSKEKEGQVRHGRSRTTSDTDNDMKVMSITWRRLKSG